MDWHQIRSKYPLVNNYTYLDNARTGAMSQETKTCLKRHIDDFVEDGAQHREEWIKEKEAAREKVAEILNCKNQEVGFLTDVSTGMSFLASAMTEFHRVILIEDDFASVGIPWVRNGYDITWISKEDDLSIDLGKIEEALKKGADLVVVGWVQYNSGFKIRLDALGELCHQYGAKLVVDGTQGFCAFPVEPAKLKVDIFMASAFKWMTAGYGISIIYISQNLLDDLRFKVGGWNSLIDFFGSWEDEANYKTTAEIVEIGHPKYANAITLNNALGELLNIGMSNIYDRVNHLSKYLQKSLQEAGIQTRSNFDDEEISGIRLLSGNKDLHRKLEAQKVKVTFREDYFRSATHFYNLESDIDRFVEMIRG